MIPLHVRSVYSLGRGTASVEELAEQAARYGHPALALTDRNNLYGMVPFIAACEAQGIRPIIGAEVDAPGNEQVVVVLLVRDATGYATLCRLLSRRMRDPSFTLESALTELHDGLHVLTACPQLLARLARHLPRENLWGELRAPFHGHPSFAQLAETAQRLGLRTVATGDVMCLRREDHRLHATLTAIRRNTVVARLTAEDLAPREAYFKAPAAMRSLFRSHHAALRNTQLIAESCRYVPRRERWIFPDPPLPPGETAAQSLRARCDAGLTRRYGTHPPQAVRRLERELEVIHRLGFTTYFVVVGEIVEFAREQGIATVGRGSGASALTAYLLGITNVDPIRYGLSFERFLHEKRPDCPDLDIDLCWIRRDDVIHHVYDAYGHDRVAMISTHNTFQPRSAFREAAKAHGISNARVNRLSKQRSAVPQDEAPWPLVLHDADRLLGKPRHLGLHPGGIVISDRPLDHYVPLEPATKGIVCTQFEMRAIESVGLVKIDLLGNRALSTIQETIELVSERHWTRLDPDAFPHEDPKTAALFTAGETLGVFQMESPAMRNLNRMLQTRDLATTIAAVALIRPGPAGSGMKEAYCRRERGLETPTYADPRLQPLLEETHGVMLYEEHVMRVAAEVAGLSLEDGDVLRRAIASASEPERARWGALFQRRARERGYAPQVAQSIWEGLLRFGAFAFCKAHAAGYGVLAWQAGWLKAHYPLEFSTALMNHHSGMYDKRTHLEEAKRRGVVALQPCVNHSAETCRAQGTALRLGLEWVRGLTETTRRALLTSRARRPFAGLEDFLCRVPAARSEAEALILAGAFDFTARTRPELLCLLAAAYPVFRERAREGDGDDLFTGEAPAQAPWPIPPLPEFAPPDRAWREWHVLGVCVERHPVAFFREQGMFPANTLTAHAAERAGETRRVRVGGIVAARRVTPTKQGRPMQFLTLEDETGLVECVLFPEAHARHRGTLRDLGPYLAEGRLDSQYGAVTLTVDRLRKMEV